MSTLLETIPTICPELGTEVAVSAIDRELRKLWEQDDARTNASLMNLVVYSEKPGALIENSEIIRELTREHACRAILVGIDPHQSDPSLRAWITAIVISQMAENRFAVSKSLSISPAASPAGFATPFSRISIPTYRSFSGGKVNSQKFLPSASSA